MKRLTLCGIALLTLLLPLSARQQSDAPARPESPGSPAESVPAAKIILPPGTKLPLILHNAISTRNARAGDPVYLETVFPIIQDDKIVVPAGSYVQGEIIQTRRPGRVKGTGEMRIRLTTLILPNGYTVRFDAIPANAGTGGNETTAGEGEIKGDTDRSTDVGAIVKSTGIGAGIGAVAARSAKGAGIGAGVGAAVGLAAVLLTRGPELELPRGTTLEAVLDRPLALDPAHINFSEPGRASDLSGPPNREPVRNRSPFPY